MKKLLLRLKLWWKLTTCKHEDQLCHGITLCQYHVSKCQFCGKFLLMRDGKCEVVL